MIHEQERINHLVEKLGVIEAKKKCLEICKIYDSFLVHPDKKLSMYFDAMRESIDQLLDFIVKEN